MRDTILDRCMVAPGTRRFRYGPEGSAVRIVLASEPGETTIHVSDAGSGVPIDQREAVFDRFTRGAESVTRSNRGRGLAFCKLAVEAHGGRIWIEDADPPPGAAFCIAIPHGR